MCIRDSHHAKVFCRRLRRLQKAAVVSPDAASSATRLAQIALLARSAMRTRVSNRCRCRGRGQWARYPGRIRGDGRQPNEILGPRTRSTLYPDFADTHFKTAMHSAWLSLFPFPHSRSRSVPLEARVRRRRRDRIASREHPQPSIGSARRPRRFAREPPRIQSPPPMY